MSPTSATLTPGATRQFSAIGWINGSSSPAPNTTWSATGGTISSTGLYKAGNTPGTYQVKVVSLPTWHSETATITISGTAQPSATISAIALSPSARTTVYKGTTQQFTASAKLSNGTTQANPAVTWSATGGSVTSNGAYTAGNTSGYFVVIARSSNGKADTTDVTIPTTAASISSIVVSPATATVASSATQQFTASAKLVGGSTLSNPEVTWSATGGTVNSSGRYTAGTTAGTYRVIARSSNGKADTSAVTVTGSAVTVTKVTLSPASVNLVAGGTQTFATQVTYSNGTTQTNPALTWSATGGTMGSGQTYTAGTVTGAYRVIATAANGKADTSVVNVTGVSSPPPSGANSMYFNSAEAGCGSDPNIILCDDFEDGDWYTKDADQANASGGLLQTDGWSGTIYANPITPAKAAVCGSRGAKGTNCTATYGTLSGSQDSRNMADHEFNGGPVTELWARWYYKADAGYRWGAEKHTNFTKAAGDIAWFNIQFNCGAGSSQSSATPYVQIIHGNSHTCQPPNASSISLQSGTWYYFEVHLKLNSAGLNADGLIEIWINDCGANGVCTGSPTLRTRMTNVSFDRNQSGCKTSPCKIETLWFENWANPKSAGTSYLDQIKVSKAGMIGF